MEPGTGNRIVIGLAMEAGFSPLFYQTATISDLFVLRRSKHALSRVEGGERRSSSDQCPSRFQNPRVVLT